MVTPVQKDSLTEYQIALATMLRITSAVSGVWTGKEIQPNPNRRSVMVPDIRVDDYIVDAEIGRIGADHYSGSEFTSEWKNGTPPIEWRRYSMSRHRSFGYVVFDEQARYSPIPNLHNEYVARKMSTTVRRDHDKYGLFAIISGHMPGKLVPRTAADTVGPYHADAARIAHTGDARDYKWIAEPGEDYDNQIQPSFATIKGMFLDEDDPLKTLDNLSIVFSDNWFDTNFQNSQRFVFVTSALELVFMNYLIEKGAGTESAFKLLKDGDISGAEAAGYLGMLKGSWKLIKVHPEWLPKVFTDSNLVVDPVADTSTANRTLRQVVGLAAYSNAAQTFEHFSERRQQDGGTRFKGTEYVQDFSYDAWAIDQLSEGIVPLFTQTSTISGDTITYSNASGLYGDVASSFNRVAAAVAGARAQLGVAPITYPITGADVKKSRPEWYHGNLESTSAIDNSLTVKETGDVAHRNPLLARDNPTDATEAGVVDAALINAILSSGTARANTAAVTLGQVRIFASPKSAWEVTTAGTTAASQPSITGKAVGATVTDGTAVFTRIL